MVILKNNKGFTLIELLVVIGIIGILAVIAVPALFNNMNKAKISKLQSECNAVKTAELTYYAENNKFTGLKDLDIEGLNIDKSPIGGIYKLLYKNENNKIIDGSGGAVTAHTVDKDGNITSDRVNLDKYGDVFVAVQGQTNNKIYIDQKGFKMLVEKFGADNVFTSNTPQGFNYQYTEFYIRLTNNISESTN